MGRVIQDFQPTPEEAAALRAAWATLQRFRGLEAYGIPTDAPDREAFTQLRKALVGLQKALQAFQEPNDHWITQRAMLYAQWQEVSAERGEATTLSQLRLSLEHLEAWLPDLVQACEPVIRGAGASVHPETMAWIICSATHWRKHLGKKPGIGPHARYQQALLTLQATEPWQPVTEAQLRTAHKRGYFK